MHRRLAYAAHCMYPCQPNVRSASAEVHGAETLTCSSRLGAWRAMLPCKHGTGMIHSSPSRMTRRIGRCCAVFSWERACLLMILSAMLCGPLAGGDTAFQSANSCQQWPMCCLEQQQQQHNLQMCCPRDIVLFGPSVKLSPRAYLEDKPVKHPSQAQEQRNRACGHAACVSKCFRPLSTCWSQS